MAEQIIQAGKKIDAVTRKELDDALGAHLRSWVAETARGGRFVRFSATGLVANQNVTIGGPSSIYQVGPGPGFIWDVRRIHVDGLTDTDNMAIYVNDVSSTGIVTSNKDTSQSKNRLWTFDRQLILYPGDTLIIANTSNVTATGVITLSGQALELPVGLAWKLT